uniref:Fork-head domain-containing protein n=1 Tax=Anopheles maculatus TaxID=74869 RepID=A0A182SMT3_9DIPT
MSGATLRSPRFTDVRARYFNLGGSSSTTVDMIMIPGTVHLRAVCRLKGDYFRDHFPYYKSHDDRWKNSVRHNLSINPHFRKGRKSSHGSGHLWTISSRNSEDNFLAWEHKKQRFEWFFKMEANARMREVGTNDTMTDAEVAAATASLAQYAPKSPTTGSPVNQVTARTEEIKHPDDDTFNGLRRGGDIQIDRPTQTIQTYEMLDSGR